jgi:hypothetical protein
MADLTPEQVQAQLAAHGLRTVDDEDLDEITHRINAFREALVALEPDDLADIEPVTTFEVEVARDDA